ncbi:sialic acid-binding Ig-like lectin 9 [Scomber scombrus]|uniref:Sialic acid-binding Ig-like lectin 9 n=1 Tax=Scomber scombrus TaxID=13677 RepID=A0AAV1QA23_SCOSC
MCETQDFLFIPESYTLLLQLLLLAELFVHSSSRPVSSNSLCNTFKSMIPQVESLMRLSKKLHDLTDDELIDVVAVENRLDSLPHMHHTAAHFDSVKVNESLSQLYVYTQAFKLHVEWLKTAKINVSLSSGSAEGANTHLLHLSSLLSTSLQQINEEVPQLPSPSLPVVSTAFDVLKFSIEISERLQVFCHWSKRVLRYLQKTSHCPRH